MADELHNIYCYKILEPDALAEKIGNVDRDKKVIMCHGVFDVVHPGHIRHLAYAKSKADILVVSLTCDKHIKKGTYRPHVPENLRALSLAAFEMVDYVVIDRNQTPLENISKLQPNFFAKGFEYSDDLPQATRDEMDVMTAHGGEMIFTPGDIVYSSSKLLEEHLPCLQMEKLISMMSQFDISFKDLYDSIDKLEGLKVHVVGDTIVDSYTRTHLIGGNTKTPTFSVLYEKQDDYVGGAGIVAQHMKAAGAQVTFTTVLGDDVLGKFAAQTLKDYGIDVKVVKDQNRPTTHKNAIIAGGYRLLKIDTLDNAPITSKILDQFVDNIANVESDGVIFSDFRHGIFNKHTIGRLTNAIPKGCFRVADSQVASRWGNITEFKGFDLVTPNEREARFALADQDSNIVQLTHTIKEQTESKNVVLKLGSKGLFFLGDDLYQSVDSFANEVKDAVGSGDALLAYSTLMLMATDSLPKACIIGSIAAACECEYDGNIPIEPKHVVAKLKNIEKLARFEDMTAEADSPAESKLSQPATPKEAAAQ